MSKETLEAAQQVRGRLVALSGTLVNNSAPGVSLLSDATLSLSEIVVLQQSEINMLRNVVDGMVETLQDLAGELASK